LSAEIEEKKLVGGTKELAILLQVTGQRVRDYVDMGMPTLMSGRNKKYDLTAAFYWYIENVAKMHSLDKEVANEEEKLESLEVQIQVEKLKKLQLDNAKTEGEYVPIDEVDASMAELFVLMTSRLKQFTRIFPDKLAKKSKKDVAKITDESFKKLVEDMARDIEEHD